MTFAVPNFVRISTDFSDSLDIPTSNDVYNSGKNYGRVSVAHVWRIISSTGIETSKNRERERKSENGRRVKREEYSSVKGEKTAREDVERKKKENKNGNGAICMARAYLSLFLPHLGGGRRLSR